MGCHHGRCLKNAIRPLVSLYVQSPTFRNMKCISVLYGCELWQYATSLDAIMFHSKQSYCLKCFYFYFAYYRRYEKVSNLVNRLKTWSEVTQNMYVCL